MSKVFQIAFLAFCDAFLRNYLISNTLQRNAKSACVPLKQVEYDLNRIRHKKYFHEKLNKSETTRKFAV